MSWKRLGVVYVPDGSQPWARSHAALPTPVHVAGDIYRFFFSSRDAEKRSHVGWVDVEVSENPRLIEVAREPVLSPGRDGTFDDSGVGVGCITETDAGFALYYMGWNLGVRSPWRNAIGMAQAPTLQSAFERFSPGPILDRSPEDPYTLSYPCVLRFGPEDWRMWYGSKFCAGCRQRGYASRHQVGALVATAFIGSGMARPSLVLPIKANTPSRVRAS